MSSHLAIYRRELSAYFTSPIGYIFLATFVIFTNLLALFVIPPGFFEYPLADMRVYFHVLAGVSAFLVAAVTMRLWAEEKKGNTFELLLTLPSREGALVAGKFLAAITFYAAGLVLTLSVPLMLMVLSRTARTASQWYGLLDPGTTLAGYLGCLLLGATFIAFGIFVSGLCADQIIAFVLTAPLLFLAYLMGLPWMEQAIDQAMSFLGPGLGEALGNYIGVFTHFNNLSRGLVDIGDILFFLVWTGIFLILNALHLERRGRQSGKTTFYLSFLVLFALGASLNWLFVELSFPRFDLTADRVFTVSEISGRVLKKTPEKIRLRYHVTPRDQMPPNLQDLERMVRDQLDTLVHASDGNLLYQVVYRTVEQDRREEEETGEIEEGQLERDLLKNVRPFPIEVLSDGKATSQLVYSALEITYPSAERGTEILPCVMESPQPPAVVGVGEIEFRVVSFAQKAQRENQPVVALYAPLEGIDPQLAMLYAQMGQPAPRPTDPWPYIGFGLTELEGFAVRRVGLSQADPLPEAFDILLVAGPRDLSPRQQYEISLAIAKGKPTLILAQNFDLDYETDYDRYLIRSNRLTTGLDLILPEGVEVAPSLVMDPRGVSLQKPVSTPLGPIPMTFPAWPMHVELSGDALAGAGELFAQVPRLRLPWVSPLKLNPESLAAAGLSLEPVLLAPPGAWTRELLETEVTARDLAPPSAPPVERPLLAALLTGVFPLRFLEKPAWPDSGPEGEVPPTPEPLDQFTPGEGKLLLVGNATGWRQDFIRYPELIFLLNSVASFTLDSDALAIRALRGKASQSRAIGLLTPGEVAWWKAMQVVGHAILLTLLGLLVWRWRWQRRVSYRESLALSSPDATLPGEGAP